MYDDAKVYRKQGVKRLAILGASGHGQVIADLASLCSEWSEIHFFDDSPNVSNCMHWQVRGNTQGLLDALFLYSGVVVGIGDNNIRQIKQDLLLERHAPLVTLIHPQSYVSSYASLGMGSVVFAQAVLNFGSSVGMGGIVNTGATIDHGSRLGDYVHISPGAHLGGDVEIGDRTWVGIGSSVRNGIAIGHDAIVGAGATVIRNVPDDQTVVGTPAYSL